MTKQKRLRYLEYYNLQKCFDNLYEKSKQGDTFTNLTELISSEENIRLAYRNIKRNKGSFTAGTDGITIKDIEKILNRTDLPAGYYYNYDGEFKNLREATNRLSIAIPAALIMILLLLYATVRNLRETLFVFSAIPLAAIGGIWALWLRGMPFSISAGVGFIALFGVAVLNGIVLIGQLNDLQKEGVGNITDRIMQGCMIRLRPVLMTALVASFGFLPMAISRGDGAEVQRPLATVVIGGLITSTLLTLVVLPAIYKTFTKK